MTPIRNAAGWYFFTVLLGTLFQVIPAIVVGHRPAVAEPMNCPRIMVKHGVGADLKTTTEARDVCATR